MEKKPVWLDEKIKAGIPQDMIPSKEEVESIAGASDMEGKEAPLNKNKPAFPSGGRRASIFRGKGASYKVAPAGVNGGDMSGNQGERLIAALRRGSSVGILVKTLFYLKQTLYIT